jgi:hypothetical protein
MFVASHFIHNASVTHFIVIGCPLKLTLRPVTSFFKIFLIVCYTSISRLLWPPLRFLPFRFPTKILCVFLLSHVHYVPTHLFDAADNYYEISEERFLQKNGLITSSTLKWSCLWERLWRNALEEMRVSCCSSLYTSRNLLWLQWCRCGASSARIHENCRRGSIAWRISEHESNPCFKHALCA